MARLLLFVFLVLNLGRYSYATCEAPDYRSIDSLRLTTGLFKIVIDPRHFKLEKLICLAESLNEQNPQWQNASVLIFTSKNSAEHFAGGPRVELPAAADTAQGQVHAVYVLDRSKHEEHIDILPFGWRTSSADSAEIMLPVVGVPHCRFEIEGRCIFALEHPRYPAEALKSQVSGTVLLNGRITPSGKIIDIRVREGHVPPNAHAKLLIDAAVHNLSSWRLDPREKSGSIEIAYDYVIDISLKQNVINVEFELPYKIVIQGNP